MSRIKEEDVKVESGFKRTVKLLDVKYKVTIISLVTKKKK